MTTRSFLFPCLGYVHCGRRFGTSGFIRRRFGRMDWKIYEGNVIDVVERVRDTLGDADIKRSWHEHEGRSWGTRPQGPASGFHIGMQWTHPFVNTSSVLPSAYFCFLVSSSCSPWQSSSPFMICSIPYLLKNPASIKAQGRRREPKSRLLSS